METLDHDVLGQILESTDAPWLARLTSPRTRAAVPPRRWRVESAVACPARCDAALRLGLDLVRVVRAAWRGGHVDTLDWLRRERAAALVIMRHCTPVDAAHQGHVDLLRWWYEHISSTYGINHQLFAKAIAGGHLEVVKWLCEVGECPSRPIAQVVACCVGHNQLRILEWLHESCLLVHRAEPDLCLCARLHGRLELLKWLRAHSYEWGDATCRLAAQANGPASTVTLWAASNGCPP